MSEEALVQGGPLQEGEILALLHIPKTAGTSLISAITASGARFAHVLDPRFHDHLRPGLSTPRDHLLTFEDGIAGGMYRVIVGHITRADIASTLGERADVRYAAMLRDPVERVISEYFYYTSHAHPDHRLVRRLYPTIEVYANKSPDTNVMCHYLESYRGQPISGLVSQVVREFRFIGRVEAYEEDVSRLLELFTTAKPPLERLNGGAPRPHISGIALRAIRRRNARDIQLFKHLSSAYGWSNRSA